MHDQRVFANMLRTGQLDLQIQSPCRKVTGSPACSRAGATLPAQDSLQLQGQAHARYTQQTPWCVCVKALAVGKGGSFDVTYPGMPGRWQFLSPAITL